MKFYFLETLAWLAWTFHSWLTYMIYFFSVFLARRIAFKDYEGRRDAAKKITEESKKIEKLFKKLAKASLEPETQCSVLPTLAEVIKLRDTSMMALEVSVSSETCHRLASLADAFWAHPAIFLPYERSSWPGRLCYGPKERLRGRLVTDELLRNEK